MAHGTDEFGIGCGGVPLRLAAELHRRLVVNREPPMPVYKRLGLTREVGSRIFALVRNHGVPSRDRLIVLSANYPERTTSDIAQAFGMSVQEVEEVLRRVVAIRAAEPLPHELWEDITHDDVWPDELRARAAAVRHRNELVKRAVLSSAGCRARRRAGVGGLPSMRGALPGSWAEDCLAGSQSAQGSLPQSRRGRRRPDRDQGPQHPVYGA